ncbi:facilitated trehalose transporter Tret1-like isoform X1 [Frieseomelitta varia]|uniref:facilitated trehalose transporter Tret1-like isoform X1 n=1 Tax=Frieseomelitta varia TaxID=561572 RepID=UPI001CB6A0C7|nr:facilitated trehalose transporter Tret1-like isoform X1 [Frieseomelitta varia]
MWILQSTYLYVNCHGRSAKMLPQPRVSTLERSVLPKYYTRVPTVARSVTNSSGINLDCSSNTTLATNASPFNSQTALIAEKTVVVSSNNSVTTPSNHYYAQNLRNNHQKALNGSRIYDPLDRGLDHDYKQLDPLLVGEPPYTGVEITKPSMSSQNVKPTKDSVPVLHTQFEKEPKLSIMRFANQVLAALSVSMGSMVVGYSSSYTSPGLVSMQKNSTFEVTKEIGMWIGSIMPLSALFGGIAGGPCIEYLGRRNTILATALPFIAAWLLIALATNVGMVLTGRALCGFCVGIASLSLPVYLGETIQPEVRGTLGLLPTAFGNTGILVCFVAGMYLDWRNLALLGASLPIPFMILMFMIPETPRWYISKGKAKRARKSLQWLRGKGTDINDELSAVQKLHTESERNVSQGALMEVFKKNNLKPVLISLGLMFFQQLSGINAVIFYTVQIFKDAGSSIDENISTIIVGIVNFISTFVAASVIDKLGRKMLLYISGISMCLTLFTFGTFFYVKSTGTDVTSFGWIPLLSLIVYVIGFSLGFGPIPWLMMGEILPVKIRGSAASVATAFNWTCTFVVTKTYEDIVSVIGPYGTFWMFGTIVVVGFVFVIICVPETRGRSLEEIEKRFAGPVRRMSAVANMKPMPMAC